MTTKCWVKHCKEAGYHSVQVHGAEFDSSIVACDNKDHFRDAQRFVRRKLRREQGVKQPVKNKAKGRR